jgi:hypothetical protein
MHSIDGLCGRPGAKLTHTQLLLGLPVEISGLLLRQRGLTSVGCCVCIPLPQDRTPVTGKPEKLMDLKGTDLLGLPVKVGEVYSGQEVQHRSGSSGWLIELGQYVPAVHW